MSIAEFGRIKHELRKATPPGIWDALRDKHITISLQKANLNPHNLPQTYTDRSNGHSVVYGIPNKEVAYRVITEGKEAAFIADIKGSLRKDDVYLDIGANIGTHSIPMAGFASRVISFEPDHDTYCELVQNIARNGLRNVFPLQVAVGRADGTIELETNGLEGMTATTHRSGNGREIFEKRVTVPQKRLDSLVSEGTIPFPTVLKIDVEGAEMGVLEGLGEIKPRKIFVEAHPQYGVPSTLVRQWAYDKGYEVKAQERGIQSLMQLSLK